MFSHTNTSRSGIKKPANKNYGAGILTEQLAAILTEQAL